MSSCYFNKTCLLISTDVPASVTASHIKPWAAATPSERLMSSNGLLLNALHDRAFDRGLITLDDRYRVVVSSRVPHTPTNNQWLYAFDGRKIALPDSDESTWPSLDFIHYHNDCVFERCA
ncbi:HNH endonuclease [Enorma massiliensis]|uniref:HNH endonuclease n=1 Tax=Enorma massiliensis TaxID=1472761 RepID=UPI003A95A790